MQDRALSPQIHFGKENVIYIAMDCIMRYVFSLSNDTCVSVESQLRRTQDRAHFDSGAIAPTRRETERHPVHLLKASAALHRRVN